MRRTIGLVLAVLLLGCNCFEESNRVEDFYSAYGIPSLYEAIRSESNHPVETSENDDPTINFSLADVLCPNATAISPCICSLDAENRTILDCTLVESEEQLATVFEQDFPVKELYQFAMTDNSDIRFFSSFMNGITFESLHLYPGHFALEAFSDRFLMDGKDTLKDILIQNSDLRTDFFPFHLLALTKLESVHIHGSSINYIPPIRTSGLSLFGVDHTSLELLENGTIPVGVGSMTIYLTNNRMRIIEPGSIFFADQNSADSTGGLTIWLNENNLQYLHAGTIPLRNGPMFTQLYENQIELIEPGTFVLPEQTDSFSMKLYLDTNLLSDFDEEVFGGMMPFMTELRLRDNPLSCDCDFAWLILNPTYMATLDSSSKCYNGTSLHDLDTQYFLDFC